MHFGCGLYIGVEFYLARGGGGGLGTYTDTGKLGRGWETLQTTCICIYILKVHDYVHLYDKHSFHAWNFMRINIDR